MSILANKTTWLVVLAVLCVGLAVGLGLNSTSKDADAARPKQLKTLWANIQSDGLTTSYKGLTGNTRDAEGEYTISFNRNVSKCARTATLENNGERALIVTEPGLDPQSIEVLTFTTDAVFSDNPFSLVVNC
jgi:hypothetical protein